MTAGPIPERKVARGLGWPDEVRVDPRIGWPRVPRETLDWTRDPALHDQAVVVEPKQTAAEPVETPAAPADAPEEESGAATMPVGTAATEAGPAAAVLSPGATLPSPEALDDDAEPASVEDVGVASVDLGNETTPVDLGAVPLADTGPVVAEPVIARPPGPRRAHFDIAEEGLPPQEETPELAVSRGTARPVPLPRPAAPRVFVVANQKGGVGKTTTSVNLAAALALGGLSVLVVDLDPQGNASTALGVDHSPGTPGTYEVLISGAAVADHVVDSTEAPGLRVLPASIDLAAAEIELVSVVARENRLLRALRGYLADHDVDYVFIDCPPSLGLLTLNALVAATEILIPIQCEYYALEGVSQLMRTIQLVTGELNPALQLSTVLLTMYDARTRLSAQVAAEVRTHFDTQTLSVPIPRSVRISEAPSYGQTVLTYHPDSAGAVSYLQAAVEIAQRGAVDTEENR